MDRLVYYVFDVLYVDGVDLRKTPLIHRKQILADLMADVSEKARIRLNGHIEADAAAVFKQACAMQVEGIVSKEQQSPYRSGRQECWIKIKCVKTDTFPIVAFVEKLAASPRRIASLYLGRWEGDKLLYAGKAQTGFKQTMLYDLRERLDPYIRTSSPLSVSVKKPKATWVQPVLQAEIAFSSVTADKLLRAPVYKGLRADLLEAPPKPPSQLTNSAPLRVPKANILQLLPYAVVPARQELVRYWQHVAPEALKYIARRPLKLVRHIRGTTFYHKGPLPPIPADVHALQIEKREGGTGTRLWIEDLAGLLGLVEIGAVELHTWNCSVDDIEHPDVMVFDLDPGRGVPWSLVQETALAIRERLQEENLESWPKLTGGKGVHLMVPLPRQRMTHNEAHRLSRTLSERIAASQPARYTTSATAARDGRIFIDYLRNGRGTTAVATYSPRALPRFPIAAPTTWVAFEGGIRPDAYTMSHPFPRRGMQRAKVAGTRNLSNVPKFRYTTTEGVKHERRQKQARITGQQAHRHTRSQ
jgi:bifunctional non-homologous end joining protein LigD